MGQGAQLAGFIKSITIYCNTQSIKDHGHVVSEKFLLFVFPTGGIWKLMTPG